MEFTVLAIIFQILPWEFSNNIVHSLTDWGRKPVNYQELSISLYKMTQLVQWYDHYFMNWNFFEGCNLVSFVCFTERAVGLHKSHIAFKNMFTWMKFSILEIWSFVSENSILNSAAMMQLMCTFMASPWGAQIVYSYFLFLSWHGFR